MQPKDAILEMLRRAGLTPYAASKALGSRSCVDALLRRKGAVSARVLASVAGVCGYRLVLEHTETGEKIAIDATPPTGE
jgi:hypothetical protein